ncbi:glycosyltransferase [Paenibacillus piscarius]|uniref:glycosyltransferase n=1 Tax=Paenibacillus piscarius TaxID=1089681 RepID=UPI001EE9064D|nr:glycosyltransferase [Paenibacillus piscarius]
MITISLCMIVKNEEAVLARCLDTIHDIVDEINIVDTGSTDSTVEIAKRYTDRVFFFPWTGNFAAARTESFKHATKEYILFLDADDVILEEDREKLRKLKETLDPSVDSVSMFYDAGTDAYGNVTLRYRRNRLVRRDRNFQWKGEAHQYLEVYGKIINENISVTHKKIKHSVGRNLNIYKTRIERGDTFSPRDYFYYGNELRENGHPEEAIKAYDKNIEMKEGWVEDKFYACINKGDCYRALGDSANELASLLQSFKFTGTPRPEACSRIGYNFHKKEQYKHAIFWYDLATRLEPDDNQWSFSYPAYSTWYPHLQMCVCYSKIGDLQTAYEHNELAAKYRPNDAAILHNRKWFEGKVKPIEENKTSAEDEVS